MSTSGTCLNFPMSLEEVWRTTNTTTQFVIGGIVGLLLLLLIQQWKASHIGYHLKLWWEFFTQSVPLISVEMTELESQDACALPPCENTNIFDQSKPGFVQCFDPSTRQYLGQVNAMTAADVHDACVKAKKAQQQWIATTTFADRRRVLRTIQTYVLQHMADICRVCARDSGKPVIDSMLGEVMTTVEKIRCIVQWGELWLQPSYRPTGPLMMHKTAMVEYVPLGIVATIAPWNYPFHNYMNHVISGILAGNAVVGKVSEHTSWSSQYFTRIVRQALLVHGHDPELVQTITGFAEAGAALVQEPLVDKIIFTGSPEIGKKVMEGASKTLKPVILELGGKDAMIIQETCRVVDVVPWILRGCFQNCGQNCVGIERVIVYESIAESLTQALVDRVQAFRQGIPLAHCGGSGPLADVDCGSMVTEVQLDIIQTLIDDAVRKGAKVLVGGTKPTPSKTSGQFYPPTILAKVTPDMDIFQKEVFGPVLTLIEVPNDSDGACLELVNKSPFGLGSYVFCGKTHQSRALALGRKIRSGMLCVNDFGSNYLVQSLPFGGVKDSGFGRFGGPEGLQALCLERSILIDTFPLLAQTGIPKTLDYPIHPVRGMGFAQGIIHLFYNDNIFSKINGIIDLIRYG
ncbi:hypothetical protein ACA910_020570 [Epithemia clementina (nom. ined.)]